VEKWLDLLTPSAAALSLLLVIALVVQAIRHGRAVRRLESRLADREGAAARVSLDRLAQLQRRVSTSSSATASGREGPRLPGLGNVAAVTVVLALVAGTAWYLFIRDDSSNSAAPSADQTTVVSATAPPQTIGSTPNDKVPAKPEPLPQPKSAYTILVLNGSGVTGAAARIVNPEVQRFGWATAEPGNAPTSDEQTSYVMFLPGKETVADNVAKDLEITTRVPLDGPGLNRDTSDVDAIVIIGKDLATRLSP
jgi:hypothetical protein